MRFSNLFWIRLCLIAVVTAYSTTPACGANKIDDKIAASLGKTIVEAAHPSAKKIYLQNYKESVVGDNLVGSLVMRYHGKISGARYAANITITIDPRKTPPKVVGVVYKDDNRIASNKQRLKGVNDALSRLLPNDPPTGADKSRESGKIKSSMKQPDYTKRPQAKNDPDKKLIAKAQEFLEDTKRAKSVLSFAHFGATYQGVETLHWSPVVDEKRRELEGYFALTVRYSWAGLLSDDEKTDLVFFFNDKGRLYHINSGKTTGLLKQFELSKLIIDLTKEAIREAVKDSADQQMKDGVEAAIKNVDAKALLRLKLILEQP